MILMLVTLSKLVEMGPELESLGAEVRELADKYGMKLDLDFENIGDE